MPSRAPVEIHVSAPVAAVGLLYGELVNASAWERTACEQLGLLAERLLEGARSRVPGAAVEIRNWHPNRGRRSNPEPFDLIESLDDALETVSRAHGFSNWAAAQAGGRHRADRVLEQAIESLLAGEIAALTHALESHPDLVLRRSHYGHRATLLHYLAANGVETYRQRVPSNAPELAALLLERGANPTATAAAYGAHLTTRDLLISSSHPTNAGVAAQLLSILHRS